MRYQGIQSIDRCHRHASRQIHDLLAPVDLAEFGHEIMPSTFKVMLQRLRIIPLQQCSIGNPIIAAHVKDVVRVLGKLTDELRQFTRWQA
ncbi:hypothetical protein D3C72_1700150 [compost metagenome]